MMIIMLAAAMMVAMLIATVFGLYDETQRVKSPVRQNVFNVYGRNGRR